MKRKQRYRVKTVDTIERTYVLEAFSVADARERARICLDVKLVERSETPTIVKQVRCLGAVPKG